MDVAGGGFRRRDERQVGEGSTVALGDDGAPRVELPRLLQLRHAQGRCHVRHVGFVAGRHDIVEPRSLQLAFAGEDILVDAVQAQQPQPARELGVGRCHHPALAGGDGLGGVEAEDGGVRGAVADHPAAKGRGQGMGCVLDHLQPMVAGQRSDRLHVAGEARDMHRHDGAGARRDRGRHPCRVDGHGRGVDIDQHGRRAHLDDGERRGDEGVGRGDDLVTRADAERLQRQQQSHSVGVHRDGMDIGADEAGEVRFKFPDLGAAGQPAGAEALDDGRNGVLADIRPRQRYHPTGRLALDLVQHDCPPDDAHNATKRQ